MDFRFFRTVLFTLAFSATPAMAAEEVDETKDAQPDGLVDITNIRGEIEVIGWDKRKVRVEGDLDSLTEEFIFNVAGDRTTIEVRIPEKNVNWGGGSDLVIHVPRGSRVSFDGVSSDGTFDDIAGGLRARTASGDIEARSIAEQIYIKTVSGDIEVEESTGQTNVSSVSGELNIDVEGDRINLDSVSGDIEAEIGTFERLYVNAVSGDADIEGRLADDGEIDISTVSGDLNLTLTEPVNARISADTGPGGDITNRLTDDPVKDKFPAMNTLSAKSGDGSGEITLRTISGEITISGVD